MMFHVLTLSGLSANAAIQLAAVVCFAAVPAIRGFHSLTSQLNLSRF